MSIVTDRRCDSCGIIRAQRDEDWVAVIPAGWDGIDRRLDFCDEECLRTWAKKKRITVETEK